jgi:dienelactone hydrolase
MQIPQPSSPASSRPLVLPIAHGVGRLALCVLLMTCFCEWLNATSVIQFSATTYNVTENTQTVEIQVQRTNDVDTVVNVDFATTNLNATAGLDYLEVTTNLTFHAGETNQMVTVSILNDGLPEGIETFQVLLANPTDGAKLGPRAIATVRITDNDKGLQIEFAQYQVREDEGSVLIGVLRGDDGNVVTVDYATADLTATAGQDYTATAGKLEFAAGEKLKLFTIPILNDGLRESNEKFRIYLTNAAGTILGTPSVATNTILDNDSGVQFEFSTYWAQETDGALTVKVLRGNDVELGAFTVDYATSNLTAIASLHYTETHGTLEFAAGEREKWLTIPILDNPGAGGDVKFRVSLSNVTGAATLFTITNTIVTVLDTTGMVAHGFESINVLPDQGALLTLRGGVHTKFKAYFDLYPIEVSSNLVDWTPLVTLQRTNAFTNTLTWIDPEALKTDRRFYRIPTNHFITPLRAPSGSFPVGVVSRQMADPSRRNRYMISTNGSFMVSIWYPAVVRTGGLPGPLDDAALLRDPAAYGGTFVERRTCFVSHALPNAPADSTQAPYPVVLYSPGGAGVRAELAEQGPNLASHGYIAVSVDHWDALGTVFPDGTYLRGSPFDASKLTTAGFQDRVKDLRFILDELVWWNDSDPLFKDRLDLNRVATMGYSWGGGVAGEFGRINDCVKAVILQDADLQNADELVRLGLSKPFLGLYSTGEGGNSTLYDHKAAQRAIWFKISESSHNNFGDDAWAYAPIDREISRTVCDFTLWFLNKYLKGLDEPMPTTAEYPRVTGFKQK